MKYMICEGKEMPQILYEEKNKYGINCGKAIWASDEMHNIYHSCGLPDILADADFVIETEEYILLIEYKNANVAEALAHSNHTTPYDPFENNKFNKIVRKYYDSLHYLRLMGKEKPIHYIFVLEYPKGDSTSRKMLRNRLKKRLPFQLQEQFASGVKLIDSVSVLSINEWNADSYYGQFPINPVIPSVT